MSEMSILGYCPIYKYTEESPSEEQNAAIHQNLEDRDGKPIRDPDERVIVIQTSRMNDTNNSLENVVSAVRRALELDISRRAKKASETP